MTAAVMAEWGVAGAFGIGVVAGLHPCPLSALGGAVLLVLAPDSGQRQWRTTAWRAGVLVLGMVVAVTLVAAVVGHGLRHIQLFSVQLPELLRPFLAPLFIMAGILQTRLFAASGGTRGVRRAEYWLNARGRSLPAMLGLGLVMALSFCPATAGLFFGVLIPLAAMRGHPTLYAVAYALGYGLPLLLVALGVATGTRRDAVRRHAATWSQWGGWVLIGLGAWLTWKLL